MRRAALVLPALVAATVMGQAYYQTTKVDGCIYVDQGRFCPNGSPTNPNPNGYWLFMGGIGTYSPCSGAALSMINPNTLDTKAITDSRGSNKSCTDASGVIRSLGNNTPSVETNGLMIEFGGTNNALQSQNLSAAPWATENLTISAPVVTANTGDVTAPDGTNTATKIVFPASTAAGQLSDVKQNLMPNVSKSLCLWLRGTGAQTFYFGFDTSAQYVTASLTSSWQRLSLSASSTGQYISIGTDTRVGNLNEPTMSAQTVYVWGVQAETGTYCSSYIPTTGSTAARAADQVSFPNPLTGSASLYALGATLRATNQPKSGNCFTLIEAGNANAANAYELAWSGSLQTMFLNTWDATATLANFTIAAGSTPIDMATIGAPPPSLRAVAQNFGTGSPGAGQNTNAVRHYVNGSPECAGSPCTNNYTFTAGTGTGLSSAQPSTIFLGARNGGSTCNVNGWITDACYGKDTAGCTP